ncbi:peptidase U32 family protein [Thermoanaerobacterium thermosaccharolyticum]|uniref:peptidase U32 family protein n=1 Tax=Thermoanaerobacterium thermosaccharolyticum TaxID=1517 RepID=UPI00177FDE41|nr:U32 family peptidase [Thermoanaerobacterium thermosaccharolyticum]MBE0067749.1 U32 family peptidase [Thermoanaerobacterium thermosaccharolyticum]MBE0227315.1 U32 family peptidase [Thermoanaerobacterium thermosaccharolyticum]
MIELLSPAGDIERVKIAVNYGADAVYFGGNNYGLRASVGFSLDEIKYAVEYIKKHNKKAYLTVNIFPHNEDLEGLPEYIYEVSKTGIDAVIISDPGVFSIIKEVAPKLEIHISTQANNVNYRSAIFWHDLGAKRIVLARELSLEEIKEIREKTPDDLELEVFVHGAMCISYSGRCLLSNYLTGRDANKGECTHPCRWKYYLVEEKRPGQYMSIEEDDRGTYIMNSKDLCMIKYIPDIIKAGVTSLKIEGRNKSSYYVAVVTKAYRKAIDDYLEFGDKYVFDESLLEELGKASNRDFTTGFYFGKPGAESHNYGTSSYIRNYNIVGMVLDYDEENGFAIVEQRNRFFLGDEVEIIGPHDMFTEVINRMYDADGNEIDVAPHPQMIVKIPFKRKVEKYYMIRKKA